MTCATCKFFTKGHQCRRFPPTTVLWPNGNQPPVIYYPMTTWTNTDPTDWCGEWEYEDKEQS